jgi:hypothetical protein
MNTKRSGMHYSHLPNNTSRISQIREFLYASLPLVFLVPLIVDSFGKNWGVLALLFLAQVVLILAAVLSSKSTG